MTPPERTERTCRADEEAALRETLPPRDDESWRERFCEERGYILTNGDQTIEDFVTMRLQVRQVLLPLPAGEHGRDDLRLPARGERVGGL